MKKDTYRIIYGIDVSMTTLDLCCLSNSKPSFSQLENTKSSISSWIENLNPAETMCVLEHTASYSSELLEQLSQSGIAVAAVNPNQSCHFIKALGIINKTDRQSAKALAMMGQSLDLPLYKMEKESIRKRKQLLHSLSALKKQRQMLRNQLHALSYQSIVHQKVKQAFEQTLETVNKQIEMLEEEINTLSDEEHERQMAQITSVVGIGAKTARALLCATGGLDSFQHDRQLAKFIGIVPSSHDSGTSVRWGVESGGVFLKKFPPFFDVFQPVSAYIFLFWRIKESFKFCFFHCFKSTILTFSKAFFTLGKSKFNP